MLVYCLACNIGFEKPSYRIKASPRHFCSKRCAAATNNLGRVRNPPKDRVCCMCKSVFRNEQGHRSSSRCGKCFLSKEELSASIRKLPLSHFTERMSLRGRHPSWKFTYVRLLNRYWNSDLLGLPCASCGYSKHVELAHRKPLHSFSLETPVGVVNSRENNVQLCPNCHWEFDKGLVSV